MAKKYTRQDLRDASEKYKNWGKWGPNDEIGTLNYTSAEDIVAATRESQSIAVGASPRGSLALLKLARCRAALAGRDFVVLDDVKAVAAPALAHRLVLRPELWVRRVSADDVVLEVLAAVPTPRAEDIPAPR